MLMGQQLIAEFSELVYHFYVFYILNLRNGLAKKNVLQKDKIYCFKCQNLRYAYIYFFLNYIYKKQFTCLK